MKIKVNPELVSPPIRLNLLGATVRSADVHEVTENEWKKVKDLQASSAGHTLALWVKAEKADTANE